MQKLLKLLIAITLFQAGSLCYAEGLDCRDYFKLDVESLLEEAGSFEANLIKAVSNARNVSETQNETQKLNQLQILIEDILNSDGSTENLAQLSNQLKQLQKSNENKSTQAKVSRPTLVTEAKQARKDYDGIQNYLKEKYNRFLDEVSQVHAISELPAHWALERIDLFQVTKEPTYSVRLNQGYRVLFVYYKDRGVNVLRISMKVTHE